MSMSYRLLSFLLFLFTLAGFGQTYLIENGQPRAEIVVAKEDRARLTGFAAMELQYYLQQATGARLPIVTEPGLAPIQIYVGPSAHTEQLGVTAEGLDHAAYRLKSGDSYLALLGDDFDYNPPHIWGKNLHTRDEAVEKWDEETANVTDAKWGFPYRSHFKYLWNQHVLVENFRQRYGAENEFLFPHAAENAEGVRPGYWKFDDSGSLIAVMHFLRSLGFRWYMHGEDGEIIPQLTDVELPTIDETMTAAFPVRSWTFYNYMNFRWPDMIWARRLGMSEGYQVRGDTSYTHGLIYVLMREEMKEKHPEYYAIVGGQRDTEGVGTACHSSEGLVQETARFVRHMFDAYDQPHYSIWPADGFRQCQCEGCEGKTPTQLVWGFANRVAEEVYKAHPDRLITCGAYTPYKEPQELELEKLSPNLGVFIANTGRSLHPLPRIWELYSKRLEGWKKRIAPGNILRVENTRHSLWDSAAQLDPFPVFHYRAIAHELQHIEGISRGECSEQNQFRGQWLAPGINHLNLYVHARTLWEPNLDLESLLKEYFTLYYGPVAEEMHEAYTFAEETYITADTSRTRKAASPSNVTIPNRIKFKEMLHAAYEKAGDTVYARRIGYLIDELQPIEEMQAELAAEQEKGNPRENAPTIYGHAAGNEEPAPTYRLRDPVSGEVPDLETTFQIRWEDRYLIIDIRCEEPDMENLFVTPQVWDGDSVALLIETPFHSYYQIEVNPEGQVFDAERSSGVRRGWNSLAEVETVRGEDNWGVTVRLPIADEEAGQMDPNHNLVGNKPTAEEPWFLNIGRGRVRNIDDKQIYTFSPTGGVGYHNTDAFVKLVIR